MRTSPPCRRRSAPSRRPARERPPAGGDEQVALGLPIGGDLETHPPLLEGLTPLRAQDLEPGSLDRRGPGPHDPVPGGEDLLASLPPAGRVADGPAVVED